MAPAAAAPPTDEGAIPPYVWEDGPCPTEDDLRMWRDVAEQLEKQQTGE